MPGPATGTRCGRTCSPSSTWPTPPSCPPSPPPPPELAAGQPWEAGLLTQLLAELTRGAPAQPAVRAALDELLAAALPRIVHLAITDGHAGTSRPGQPRAAARARPGLAAPLADQMPEHSVRLAALAATLTSQQVTQDRADARGGEPDAANRLAGSLNNLSVRLAGLGRREDALAAIQEAVTIRRELAAARPDAFRPDLAMSLNNLSARLAGPGPAGGRAGRQPGGRRALPGAGRGPPGRVRPRPGQVAEQPVAPAGRAWAGARTRWPPARKPPRSYRELAAARPDAFRPDLAMSLNNLSARLADLGRREDALAAHQEAATHLPGAGRGPPGRVPPRPGQVAEQPVGPAGGAGPAGGRAGRQQGSRPASTGSWPRPARTHSGPTWPCR